MTVGAPVDEQLIAELFDIQPDSVVWFIPIFEAGKVTDFEVGYCNEAGAHILKVPKREVAGARLSSTPLMDATSRKLIFEQCLKVWEEGAPIEYTYYSPGFDRYFRVQRSRVRDGILSITRDRTEEVKADLQIKDQSRLLNGIIDGSPYGIALYKSVRDEEGRITDFRLQIGNQKSAELTGFTLDELYNSTVKELIAIRGNTGYFEICKGVVETGKPVYLEYYSQMRKVWLAFSIVKHDDGYLLNYIDITSTKHQAEQLKGILEASMNGIMALEGIRNEQKEIVDFRITQVNEAFSRILGMEEKAVTGNTFLSVFSKAKEIGAFDLHVQTLLDGKPAEKEFYYNGEGINGWYRLSICRMGDNGLVQTFTEITESIEFKQKLEEAALFMQEVINGTHTGILVVSPVYNADNTIADFRFKTVNRTVALLVGQDAETLVGELLTTWFPEYKSNGAFKAFEEVLQNGQPQYFQNHFESSITDKWMDISAGKIGDDILISFHDFTPLKKLQIQLEATIGELSVSNERLSQFAHVASHDLKEPLRKIMMYSDMMEQQAKHGPNNVDFGYLQRVRNTGARMQDLINDLLSFAQANKRPQALEPVPLEEVVHEVITDLEVRISEYGGTIKVDNMPVIAGDSGQLRQLFQNLISNALKFHKRDEAPHVQIWAKALMRRDLPEEIAGISPASHYHCITVTDNGIGFEKEYKEKIFQIFQRLHSNTEYEGTGIGLAIVSKVMENHHGYILADAVPGAGATFSLYFPA